MTLLAGPVIGRRLQVTVRESAVTLERAAFGVVLLLALCVGLGDIGEVSAFHAVVLNVVRGLLPLAIGLLLLKRLLDRRWPAFPSSLAWPTAAWLAVLVASTALAPSNRLEALASLERPASGALLAWAVYELARTRLRWRLLAQTAGLGGLLVAVVGLAEASGIPAVGEWLAGLHDGSIPIGDVPRIASTLSHPNEAAILLELSLPLLVAWAWTASERWRVPLALGALCNVVAIVLTFSRAGVVAGLAGLAVMAGLCVARGERRPLLSLSAAALAVPAAFICAAMADEGLDRRLTAELTQPPALLSLPSAQLAAALGPQSAQPPAQPVLPAMEPSGLPGLPPSQPTTPSGPQSAQPSAQFGQPAAEPPIPSGPPSAGPPAQLGPQSAQPSAQFGQPAAQPPASSGPQSAQLPASAPQAPGAVAQPSRMEFWTAALDMLSDHPWLGVGPDNFRWRFAGYTGVLVDNLGIHAHDQYLETLADTGVLGLLTLGWLLVRLVRTALDGVRRATAADWPWRAALLASLSAWLLHALLDDFERFWPASVAFWLLAGLNLRHLGGRAAAAQLD